ncbi:MAG: cytochrome c biogenesis protein CcmE [Alphaproteobacteria bacterium RIFOXYD12_FULL_60_8]|nr:MAG: cytochrome c biogenesis protein CcmE [Alphaproteobacteria bacterium RIFOXYD12_FULL_60_8]
MTRKQRRLYLIGAALVALFAAAALILTAFNDNLVFFYSPTDLQTKPVGPDQRIRLGGLVEEGSLVRDGDTALFVVTDLTSSLPVKYTGILPDLFREGQGVVAEGTMAETGTFIATNVLAKHDENYMPPEVADALKKSGQWKDGGATP